MGDKLFALTSLSDWAWGETAVVAVLVLIGVLTMRSVIERDKAIVIGKGAQARLEAYEARWRTGGPAGA
jgi:hypothetical protein